LLDLDVTRGRGWHNLMRTPDWRQKARLLDRIRTLLERLPPAEQDVIDLYFFKGMSQEVIASLLDVTQQAVSHRMYKAFRRLIFLFNHPDIAPDRLREDMRLLVPPHVLATFCDFAQTSSQAETARRTGVPIATVNSHLMTGIRLLRKHGSVDALFYMAYFSDLLTHHNILREVCRGVKRGRARGVVVRRREAFAQRKSARTSSCYA
jgi:hypothetical protein